MTNTKFVSQVPQTFQFGRIWEYHMDILPSPTGVHFSIYPDDGSSKFLWSSTRLHDVTSQRTPILTAIVDRISNPSELEIGTSRECLRIPSCNFEFHKMQRNFVHLKFNENSTPWGLLQIYGIHCNPCRSQEFMEWRWSPLLDRTKLTCTAWVESLNTRDDGRGETYK
jgi:hypothetical protein